MSNYLNQVLLNYKPRNMSLHNSSLSQLMYILKNWANGCFVQILESGSMAKGTAISLSSDVDYLISLTSNCNENIGGLRSIYNSLYTELSRHYNNIRKQNVSIRIIVNGLKIDITPARKYSGNTNYHSLYLSKRDTWTQTNIQQHINDVKNSNRLNEIKLLKIWRELNRLNFTSIYLEYIVLDILKYKPYNNLENNFLYILQELAKDFNNPLNKRITDPSNSNNILSDLLSVSEKEKIKRIAKISITKKYWNEILW